MNSSAQLDLLAALGYAVFERSIDGRFICWEAAPPWLPAGRLTDTFPFLEVFLPDAEEFWAEPLGSRSTLHSDFWTQTGHGRVRTCISAQSPLPEIASFC